MTASELRRNMKLSQLSEEQLTKLYNNYRYGVRSSAYVVTGLILLLVSIIFYMMFNTNVTEDFSNIMGFACVAQLLVFGAFMYFNFHCQTEVDRLKPLSEFKDDTCEQGLKLVNESNASRKWVENATMQGRQLRKLDFEIMKKLHVDEYTEFVDSARREACNKLHMLT